jgi:hypothetical protein
MAPLDPELHRRRRRVQDICAQLANLVSLSVQQRRRIDRLLGELEDVAKQVKARTSESPRAAGSGA